eukprot:CAMPEP_0203841542 /NCGR_PEP_ID=MMETSP0359-20131031/1448_1 /ASSEMBLY_ACC=CAM_ASM_000338 /TAXON_ID=268821 /ORGANISM="Scrippsiella Hangoei, Strain SHTV-5" /LENGTH=129 /DNA_ID=CAMNT_0050755965 /DNA_START=298 /DNA_END=685 /DNA_ORIENTATION=-
MSLTRVLLASCSAAARLSGGQSSKLSFLPGMRGVYQESDAHTRDAGKHRAGAGGAFMATTSYSPRPPPTNLLRKLSMATADEAHDGRRGLLSTTSQAVKLVPSKRIATLAASQRAGGRARRGRALGRPL